MTIELRNITKVVEGKSHIYETNLSLEPGSFNVLLGTTLSGKTSLLRLIAGLDKPTTGEILMNGENINKTPLQQRNIGMVYQEFINYPSFTVFDNIASPLRIKKCPATEIEQKVKETAAMMGLDHLLDRYPQELSGGQQQRLAMARALIKSPSLLLLDEPLVNLDYKLRENLRLELIDIIEKQNIIVVYATTDPMETLMLGGNTIVLHEGQMVQSGPVLEVFNNPARVEVALTFNDPPMNLLKAKLSKQSGKLHFTLADGTTFGVNGHLSQLPEGDCQLGFRCFHGSIYQTDPTDIEIKGHVELAELSGSETFIHARHDDVSVVVHETGAHVHAIGDEITFYIQPKHFFAFDSQGHLLVAPPEEQN